MEKFKRSDTDTMVAMQTNPQGNRQRETQAQPLLSETNLARHQVLLEP